MIMNASKLFLGACTVYAIAAACGSSGSGGGNGPVTEAGAQDSCGTCTVPGTVRVVSADMDAAQAVGGVGTAQPGQWQEVASGAAGAFYVTDVTAHDGQLTLGTAPASGDCSAAVAFARVVDESDGTGAARSFLTIHGGRMLIRADEKICVATVFGPTNYRWAGFRPYET